MATCKSCICYDPVHRWCVLGRERNPKDPACEWYVQEPDTKDIGQEE